jgi:DNA-binding response OmpR family regulator
VGKRGAYRDNRFGFETLLKKFSKDRLGEVEVYLGEANDQVREGLRSAMRDYGLRRTRSFARMSDLMTAITEAPPDFLLVSDELGPAMLETIRDIRHYKIGRNPFLIITMMVRGDDDGAVKRAMMAGADDVMIKPVAPGRMMDRLAHMAMNRVPFIVTNDYIGPERRKTGDTRPSLIKTLQVVNTLKSKIEGARITPAELSRAVEGGMQDVMAARLDSHGLKLGWVCKAYAEQKIDKDLEERLLILVGVLEDAARTAVSLGQADLSQICTQMARQVEEMAENYENPNPRQLGTIEKLTKAFERAKTVKMDTPAAA